MAERALAITMTFYEAQAHEQPVFPEAAYSGVCRIEAPFSAGTGFFFEFQSTQRKYQGFLTCNHVIVAERSTIREKKERVNIHFENNNKAGIKTDDFVTLKEIVDGKPIVSYDLDFYYINIKQSFYEQVTQSNTIRFLKPLRGIKCDNLLLVHYPRGGGRQISPVHLVVESKDVQKIDYYSNCDLGSSGGPLIVVDRQGSDAFAFGMHRARNKELKFGSALLLEYIIADIIKQTEKQLVDLPPQLSEQLSRFNLSISIIFLY